MMKKTIHQKEIIIMKYSIGDVVAIRRLKDLFCEFPLDSNGDIITRGYFNKIQFKYCGHKFTICELHTFTGRVEYSGLGYKLNIPEWRSWLFYEGFIDDAMMPSKQEIADRVLLKASNLWGVPQ